MKRLTRAQRALIYEMAKDERVILLQKHQRLWCGVSYMLNSFPIRALKATMVASLAQQGYLALNIRGYYMLTARGQLEASITDTRKKT